MILPFVKIIKRHKSGSIIVAQWMSISLDESTIPSGYFLWNMKKQVIFECVWKQKEEAACFLFSLLRATTDGWLEQTLLVEEDFERTYVQPVAPPAEPAAAAAARKLSLFL